MRIKLQAPGSRLQASRVVALAVASAAVLSVAACDDATGLKAQLPNIETKPVVYAMNGTPPTLNSAIHIRSASASRMDAAFLYDLAFDMDATGAVQVYSVARLASELMPTHRVGMQIRNEGFTELKRAPGSGYVYDTLMTLPVGKLMVFDVIEQFCASSFFGINIRGKLMIDSVNVTTKAIYLHILSDPNCGFRGLDVGEPKD